MVRSIALIQGPRDFYFLNEELHECRNNLVTFRAERFKFDESKLERLHEKRLVATCVLASSQKFHYMIHKNSALTSQKTLHFLNKVQRVNRVL